jgi:hypothetical protein
MTRQQGEWVGYSYRWNDAQDEAELVESPGVDVPFTIREPSGKSREQVWHYPSRAECMICHSRAAQYVLGLNELQMNKLHDYGGRSAEQLRTLAHLGMFRETGWEVERAWSTAVDERVGEFGEWLIQRFRKRTAPPLKAGVAKQFGWDAIAALTPLPSRLLKHEKPWLDAFTLVRNRLRRGPNTVTQLEQEAEKFNRFTQLHDASAPLEARARAYLHANCAYCHVEAGGGNSRIELESTVTRERSKMFNELPVHNSLGIANPRIIAPGDAARSVLFQRVNRRGPGQMPPLATSRVDHEAAELLRAWIDSLPSAVPVAPRD